MNASYFTRIVAILFAVSILSGLSLADDTTENSQVQFARTFAQACVAADHPLASEAGVEMLRRGGNVVDAAVATAVALSVVRPESSGLGGGGFMIIWDAAKRQAVVVDYRERAPAGASRDMFLADDGTAAESRVSQTGGLAVAVPEEVAGLCFILEEYGTLDRRTVLEPALRLARDGFAVDETFVAAQQAVLDDFQTHPDYAQRFAPLLRMYLNDGVLLAAGQTFHSPLSNVLERIANEGAAGFTRGAVAESIVDEVTKQGGILTLEDLAAAKPVVREPLRENLDGDELIVMPPPSSGGVAILEILNILSAYEVQHPGSMLAKTEHNRPEAIHLVTEALKHAFADRAAFLGDMDFADVPLKRLLSAEHASRLAAKIDASRTLPMREYGAMALIEDGGTSHFCVMDAMGNAVACTETINTLFGSYVVDPIYGVVLNNEMDDFAAIPGKPNAFGLVQSEANAIAPGKKPLSSMSPTILVRDGKAVFAVGGSGGPRIISGTLQTLLNVRRFGMRVGEAVSAPRFHHQWLPEILFVEPELAAGVSDALQQRGHVVESRDRLAAVQAVMRTSEGVAGASDPRKGGRPAGH